MRTMRKTLAERTIAEPRGIYQLRLPLQSPPKQAISDKSLGVEKGLERLLQTDLTFSGQKTTYATHPLHAFAAKFPPQLPRLFINELTRPGERVLDPMAGSGTTLVEAVLAGRKGIGTDLDPLATLIAKVKTTPLNLIQCHKVGTNVLRGARSRMIQAVSNEELAHAFSPDALKFFHYWFEEHTINELYSLVHVMSAVDDRDIRDFLQVVFSSVIITKSGGVTRARDLAHSRPHRDLSKRIEQNALDIFKERLEAALEIMATITDTEGSASMVCSDARRLPLADKSIHLIVTSPPYAANAIDYMRGHKFSLIWLGHEPSKLTKLRSRYIGSELLAPRLELPSDTANSVILALRKKDERRAAVVAYYFYDLLASLREMKRVIAEERAVVIVVGSSTIRGVGIKVPTVMAELAQFVGFRLVGVAKREILRNARMMPTSHRSDRNGIEARMHEEGVVGLINPKEGATACLHTRK